MMKFVLALAALIFLSPPAFSQISRGDTIRLVVPFAAGGTSDLTARVLAQAVERDSGINVVVENRPGGFTTVGLDYVMRRPADGRTLFLAANGVVTHRFYLPNTRVDPITQLSVITMVADSPMAMMVANNVPATNVREFVEHARQNQQSMNYATVGQGGTLQMGADLFLRATGLSITSVPYQGGAPATLDLTAGRIQLMFDSVAVGMQAHRGGNARAMAVTSPQRSRHAPDIPTFKELGYDIDFTPWQALFVSAATPEPIRLWLNDLVRRSLQNPATVERFMELGMENVLGTSLAQSEQLLAAENARWQRILGNN